MIPPDDTFVHVRWQNTWSPDWQYHPESKLWWRGTWLWVGGKCYQREEVFGYFSQMQDEADFKRRLQAANGSFALVWEHRDQVFAAADHMRSFPLFYSQDLGKWCLSDQVPLEEGNVPQPDMDQVALFPYAAHTLGHRTLSQDWKQVQGGEYVVMSQQGGPAQIVSYYTPLNNPTTTSASQDIRSVALDVFDRLCQASGKRQLVVPLSGGYDSRFIAAMLKKMGRDQVLCYTYGRPDSYEVQISEQVAKQLGYPWEVVTYDQDSLAPYLSDVGRAYQDIAGAGASVAHEQDWTAIRVLKDRGILADEAIILPGFGGDVLAGSWCPKETPQAEWTPQRLQAYITAQQKFFSGERVPQLNHAVIHRLIAEELSELVVEDPSTAFSAIQYWGLRNRMAKLLINAVRVYEHWGYGWQLPFFDHAWMDTWLQVADRDKLHKHLYLREARDWLFAPMGIDVDQPTMGGGKWRQMLKRYLRPSQVDWLKARLLPKKQIDLNNDLILASLFCQHHGWPAKLTERYSLNFLMGCSYLQRHLPAYTLPWNRDR